MATKHLYASDIHFNQKIWQNEIAFFQQEIKLYEGYLAEVAGRWTDTAVLAELEHFQNQFIINKEQAEILSHDIKIEAQKLAEYSKENESVIDHKYFDNQVGALGTMAERMDTYRSIYNELKTDFKKFLAKYL